MLNLQNVSKIYRTADVETWALNDISLEIASGEFVAIMGPSGCGKSTLLSILGLLDQPSRGSYLFDGDEIAGVSERRLTSLRGRAIGFIFQSFNLIDDLNVEENVEVGLIYREPAARARKALVLQALERVDMRHRAKHLPRQLSGGQQQRVAVARAMVGKPKLILADEPTGNLDTANGDAVMALLRSLNEDGTTVVMVTHSPSHAAQAKRTIRLLDGRFVSQTSLAA